MSNDKLKEVFVRKALSKHGTNKYNYDNVEYVTNKIPVETYCNRCKSFFKTTPLNHTRNLVGCKCYRMDELQSKKKIEFLKLAKETHNDSYDYSDALYTNNNNKILIKCNECGEKFWQKPRQHINTEIPCPHCSPRIKKNNEKFIGEMMKKYGNAFDYSKVEYITSKHKVVLICNKCSSEILIRPNDLITRKYSCIICNTICRDSESFIRAAIEKHGQKYSYNEATYSNAGTKVKILCNNCGKFFKILPHEHLSGLGGCAKCSYKSRGMKRRKALEQFIFEARNIHGDDFDYSEVVYTTALTKVKLIHKKCTKSFLCTPNAHLSRYTGCPNCSTYIGEKIITLFLDRNKIEYEPQYSMKDCKNVNALRFDFGVTFNGELKCVIEYQGAQHFRPVQFGGISLETAIENFKYCKTNDKIKKEYCKKNNILLFEIKYTELKKIDNILEDFFHKINLLPQSPTTT